jgi:hypothetical protein
MCEPGMTPNILPTDIELASKLVASGRPPGDIVAALVSRGIDPATAAQVADNLLHGRRVEPQIPAALEISPRRRRRSSEAGPQGGQPAPTASAPQPSASSRNRPRNRPGAKRFELTIAQWLLAIAAVCAVGVAIGLLVRDARLHSGRDSQQDRPRATVATRDSGRAADLNRASQQNGSPAEKSAVPSPTPNQGSGQAGASPPAVAAATKPLAAQPDLELKPDGLVLHGKLITRSNVLAAVTELFGKPRIATRSGPSEKGIYAFDTQGVLVYSGEAAGAESVVLDCDGTGGANGAVTPFGGSLRIEDHVIRPDTDSETLAAFKQLGLNNPGTGGSGIFSGRYQGFDLAFAYLRSPRRLSLIEIDLK